MKDIMNDRHRLWLKSLMESLNLKTLKGYVRVCNSQERIDLANQVIKERS